MKPIKTFADIIWRMEHVYDNPKALNYMEKDKWKHISSHEFVAKVKRLTYGLISLGLKRGDKVGILAYSSPNWVMADMAVVMAGGVSVPLFHNISNENFIYEVGQSSIRYLFVEGHEQWLKFGRHKNLFETVIGLDEHVEAKGAFSFEDVLKMGEELMIKKPELFDKLGKALHEDELVTIIYTSGSTGVPKGAQLTHKNLVHLINQEVFYWRSENDRYLSILPLAHVFARQINLIMLGLGISQYFLNELPEFASVCKTLKPTGMIVVPRFLEKMYGVIYTKLQNSKGIKRKIGVWAFNLAVDEKETLFKKYILKPIAKLLVYSKIFKAFGGRFHVILCGGAKLDPKLCRFFLTVGFPIYEGWGLTEASTATVNRPGKIKIGTVGLPLAGVKVKLGEEDEILLGGPTVMKGYYRNDAATALALDEEGWFHTGDKGEIDEEGFLKIVGRIKEQYKLSTGEYVVPGRIEESICRSPLVEMAMVIGEGKKHVSCLLFPDYDVMRQWKKMHNLMNLSDEEFLESPVAKEEIQRLIEQVNSKINNWEHIFQYRFILEKPTVDGGELTPTLQLRRRVVLDKYQDLVDSIYVKEAA